MDVGSLGRVVAISPHLDDAVLSAGALLAMTKDPTVVTVFAGHPPAADFATEWDTECGFVAGDDVVGSRRLEDRLALAHVGATARWLDFLDEQYCQRPADTADIEAELQRVVRGLAPDSIAFPLGIDHPDHLQTFEACLALLEARPALQGSWLVWADVPYRARHPALVSARLDALRAAGFYLEPFQVEPSRSKRAAVNEYPTQLRGLGASTTDASLPEELFVLTTGA
jgi:LmbE family N-acetylglucosaminyl deacetylase